LLASGQIPRGRILVPGCGTGYDLATLASAEREVVGLDISDEARDAFLERHGDLPGSVSYEVGDFFSYEPGEGFDFVWDYTFFCALDPERRGAWSETMRRLVKPTGLLATLLFPFEDPISPGEGPPWPINTDLVRNLLEGSFESLEVTEMEETHPGREGRERLALWRRREP
jgi:SAM-dependent methyltransferase